MNDEKEMAETKYCYDAGNRLTEVQYPDGSGLLYEYDEAGNLISQKYRAREVLGMK